MPHEEIRAHPVYSCKRCKRNASLIWWKCCPEHTTLTGPDAYCQSCVEIIHPGEEEFKYKEAE